MEPVVWTVEGSAIYGEYHAPPKRSKVAVLLLHGFNTSLKEFGDWPARLAERGFHVLAFDQRGFGASGGERGRVGLGRAIRDVEGALTWIEQELGRVKVYCLGHSLGGAYAAGIQARQEPFKGLILAHAVDCIFDELTAVERAGFHAIGRAERRRLAKGSKPRRMPYRVRYRRLFVDKAAAQQAKEDGFLSRWVNMGNYEFAATMKASAWAAKVDVPALCIQSAEDQVVDPAHSEAVYTALAGDVDMLSHRGGHSCFRDLDSGRLLDGVADWLNTQEGR